VVHCDRIKMCEAQVLKGEDRELGFEYTEQGTSGFPNAEIILEDQVN
jgi:hypothetical protein